MGCSASDRSDDETALEQQGLLCEEAETFDTEATFEIRIENASDETIYLAGRYGCSDPGAMVFRDASGAAVAQRRDCEAEVDSNINYSCEEGTAYKLTSGAHHVVELATTMVGDSDCSLELGGEMVNCSQMIPLVAGDYSFEVSWYAGVGANMDCEVVDDVACEIMSSGSGDRNLASVSFSYPSDEGVVLVIE